jgi:MOSC domain-containing protein YiiM
MKLISVNVGLPKTIRIEDTPVSTGIFKEPVSGTVRVATLNLDGDGQADLTVHGGPDKAVYVYPSEHYPFWRQELGEQITRWGAFGENLTVEGLSEDSVGIGDAFGIGSAILQITQPRLPCFKLAAKFEREDIIKRFLQSRRTGFYVRVLKEGSLRAGDGIVLLSRESHHVTIHELTDLYLNKNPARSLLERVLGVESLSDAWREHFNSILARK